MRKINFDARKVRDKIEKVASLVANWTAQDVKRTAARSMKSGGKKRASKSFKVSKPGDPPFYHSGGIKKAIGVEPTPGGFMIGPKARGASSALRALEKGGESTISTVVYSPEYKETLKRRPSRQAEEKRPATARVYERFIDGKYYRQSRYRKFTSRAAWERATKDGDFLNWARHASKSEKKTVEIEARPYMAPALSQESTSAKIRPRIERATLRVIGGVRRKRK